MKNIFFIIILLLGISSCVKVELEDMPEPTPPKPLEVGKVTLTTNWTNRTTGIEIPASYTVSIDNKILTYTTTTNQLPQCVAGTFPTLIHNTADKTSITGTKATVATTSNIVDPKPGWLFTSMLDVTYITGEDKAYTANMKQEVRQLTFILKPAGATISKITGVEATMSGVTSVWDFSTNTPEGTAANVKPVFAKQVDGTWQATVRLLGVIGSEQKLTTTFTFSDGITVIIDVTDLSPKLSDFNTDKKIPLKLEAKIVEMHDEAGFSASINDWEKIDGNSVIAW